MGSSTPEGTIAGGRLASVADLARRLAGCRRASLMLPDTTGDLRVAGASGLSSAIVARARVRLGDPVAGIVARTRRSLVSNDGRAHHATPANRYRSPSFISVPIPLAGEGCGVLNVADPIDGRPFEGDDLLRLEGLAAYVARDLTDSPREQQLRQLQETVRELRRQVIQVQEDERRRIARDLHDEAGHALSTAIFQLDLEAARLADSAPDLQARLVHLRGGMVDCVDTLHNLAFTLRPRILEDLGLTAALRSLVNKTRNASQLQIALAVEDQGHALGETIEMVVFRVAQEALTNVCKHARATRVAVRLSIGRQRLRLTIEDNGVGMAHHAASPRSRPALGLAGMRERVELLGGTCIIGSPAKGGTRVAVTLPLEGERGNG